MMRAIWNGVIVAESAQTELLLGNHYFPPGTVNAQYLRRSAAQKNCPWIGTADFLHLEVGGERVENACWFYPSPRPEAREIRNYVAFGEAVEIQMTETAAFSMAGN